MQALDGSVGSSQTNNRHDVALVQAALNLATRSTGSAYLAGGIDGAYGRDTQAAIDAFQSDHGADVAPVAAGIISPGGHTFNALASALPPAQSDLHVLRNQRTVFLGRPVADAAAAAGATRGDPGLRTAFRARVADLITAMHQAHALVLSLTPSGGRRTFAQQAAIAPPSSYAGPGESNHNYGNAVDLGFNDTTWIQRNGTLRRDNHWLGGLDNYDQPAATAFWDARDAIALGARYNLFRLRFERIHLQDFNEQTTSSGRSLAAHLTNVGRFRWSAARYDRANRDWHYACDLGGNTGQLVEVGTANQVWAGNAAVTAAEIQRAGWIRPPLPGVQVAPGPAPSATLPITRADISAVRVALQADFQAADAQWALWTPVA